MGSRWLGMLAAAVLIFGLGNGGAFGQQDIFDSLIRGHTSARGAALEVSASERACGVVCIDAKLSLDAPEGSSEAEVAKQLHEATDHFLSPLIFTLKDDLYGRSGGKLKLSQDLGYEDSEIKAEPSQPTATGKKLGILKRRKDAPRQERKAKPVVTAFNKIKIEGTLHGDKFQGPKGLLRMNGVVGLAQKAMLSNHPQLRCRTKVTSRMSKVPSGS